MPPPRPDGAVDDAGAPASLVSAEMLGRLAGKYETLAALRRARARGEPIPPAPVFKALARAFPGCLNELDTLPLDTLDARAEALRRAAGGGGVEPWMAWIAGYHALLRAALAIKVRVASAPLDEARAERIAGEVAAREGLEGSVDVDLVRAVADPPRGRLVEVVLARLERWHGCPAELIKRTLFPSARR